jgi:adenylate cyclase
MLKPLPSDTKKRPVPLPSLALSCIAFGILLLSGFYHSIDINLYDICLRLKIQFDPLPLNSRIIRIDLNDSSEKELEEAVNSRLAFADLVDFLNLCGSQAAFDIIFRNTGPHDKAIADAALGMETLILSAAPVPEAYSHFSHENLSPGEQGILAQSVWHIKEHGKGTIPRAGTFIMSNPAVSASAAHIVHIGVEADKDGVYRRTPLFYRWGDGVIPALSLSMAAAALRIDPAQIEFFPGKEVLLPLSGDKPIRIPVDKSGCTVIPFTSTWFDDTYRVSFSKAARAKNDPGLFDELFPELTGGIVLVADTTTAKKDFGITPFETVYPLSGIHASIVSGILNDRFYTPLGVPGKAALLFIAGLITIGLCFLKKDLPYHLGFLSLFILFSSLIYVLWHWKNIIPWYGVPAAAIFVFWLVNFIFRLFSRYKEQLLFRNALTRYFPRSLAERISAEGSIDLVPAYKELTILFSDISGFTRWSADKEPNKVHALLSAYLESMSHLLFAHGGTIDKFMGDGILAFFGDPIDQSDHAERAVKAAIAMQKRIAELSEFWFSEADIHLRVRIGINSGRVIVGNLGTKTRVEYTVIGSAVNLAQRMESSAPAGGILAAKNTWELTRRLIPFKEKRLVTVKGYDEPIEAYEVAG